MSAKGPNVLLRVICIGLDGTSPCEHYRRGESWERKEGNTTTVGHYEHCAAAEGNRALDSGIKTPRWCPAIPDSLRGALSDTFDYIAERKNQ